MHKRGLSWVVVLLLLLNEAADAIAQYCFKRAAQGLGEPRVENLQDALAFAIHSLGQGYLWAGMGVVLLVFVSWAVVLKKIDLSVAVPLTSTSYVFVAVMSLVFLHEQISPLRWAGIALILVGVAIVSHSSEHPHPEGGP